MPDIIAVVHALERDACRPCRRRRRRAPRPASRAWASTSSRRPAAPWRPTRRARRLARIPSTSGCSLNCCSRSCAEVVASAYSRSTTKPMLTRSSPVFSSFIGYSQVPPICPYLAAIFSGHGPIVWITRSSGLGTFQTSLTPELPHLRLASVGEVELLDGGAREVPPAALGEHGGLRLDVGPRLEVGKRLAVLAAALVTGAHADHAPGRRPYRTVSESSTISCVAAVSVRM